MEFFWFQILAKSHAIHFWKLSPFRAKVWCRRRQIRRGDTSPHERAPRSMWREMSFGPHNSTACKDTRKWSIFFTWWGKRVLSAMATSLEVKTTVWTLRLRVGRSAVFFDFWDLWLWGLGFILKSWHEDWSLRLDGARRKGRLKLTWDLGIPRSSHSPKVILRRSRHILWLPCQIICKPPCNLGSFGD